MEELILEAEERGNASILKVNRENLRKVCNKLFYRKGYPLRTVICTDERNLGKDFTLRYVFENAINRKLIIVETQTDGKFPSVAKSIPAANWFEREIKDMFGLIPEGHPDLRPLFLFPENYPENFHPLRKDAELNVKKYEFQPRKYSYKEIEGEGIFNILVGPIHAGIIEPGHFRFSLIGEPIVNLEIRHGWKHKGIEKLFESKTYQEGIKLAERVSGDNSFSHSLCFASAVENLSGIEIPERAKLIRTLLAEIERITNHVSDFAFLFGDIGYTFGAQRGHILKEKLMRLQKEISGHRFLRGVNRIGGVNVDIDAERAKRIREVLKEVLKDFKNLVNLMINSAQIMDRYETTGTVKEETIKELSAVGVIARASNVKTDTRLDLPYLCYEELPLKVTVKDTGDVLARALVRAEEVEISAELVGEILSKLEKNEEKSLSSEFKKPEPYSYAISAVESPRGNLVYFVMASEDDKPFRIKVRDPSFMNWQTIQFAVLGDIVADFPLINKSMNLSYSGNDL